MRTARLVGPTADGRSVVLMTEDGEELTVSIDPDDPADPLARSLSRQAPDQTDEGAGDETGPGTDGRPTHDPDAPSPARRPPRRRETPPMDTPLSPRDIQQRIRAGESLEDLLASTGMDPERVERFAAPVLAEREHMALTALSGSVRRRGESSGHRPLRTVVAERLLGQGVDADEVVWDAWKRDDGQWQVVADFEVLESERHAEFRFDPQGRFSLAEDDDARWLAGERPSPVAALVDRDDELALVRATRELGTDDETSPDETAQAAQDDAEDADLEVTEDLVAVLQVVPPAELSVEELAELTDEDLGADADAEDDGSAHEQETGRSEDARPRPRDEAAEPTIAVVRRLTQVTVEVDAVGFVDETPRDEGRSALDTLYEMLGGDGYAEESTRVYAGLSDASAVPVVDEHEFEPPADVLVPAEPGPEAPEREAAAPEDTLVDLTSVTVVPAPSPAASPAGTAEPDAEADGQSDDQPTEPAEPDAPRPAAEAPPAADVDEPLIPAPGASRKPGRRKRASVPSWDEIMFGGPKPG